MSKEKCRPDETPHLALKSNGEDKKLRLKQGINKALRSVIFFVLEKTNLLLKAQDSRLIPVPRALRSSRALLLSQDKKVLVCKEHDGHIRIPGGLVDEGIVALLGFKENLKGGIARGIRETLSKVLQGEGRPEAASRELFEETTVRVSPEEMKFVYQTEYVGGGHRGEVNYYSKTATFDDSSPLPESKEGTSVWVDAGTLITALETYDPQTGFISLPEIGEKVIPSPQLLEIVDVLKGQLEEHFGEEEK